LFPDAAPPACPDQAFDTFWRAYPRHVGKADARKAFTAALRRAGGVDVMLATIAEWVAEWRSRPQFCPYPATWLRRDGWCDDPPVRRVVERRLNGRETALAIVGRRVGAM